MNSQDKIVELVRDNDLEINNRGANAEAKIMAERPDLERGSEEFYAAVLKEMTK